MVAKEYCWAITQAKRRSYCFRLDSGVLEFGFQLVSVAYNFICIYKRIVISLDWRRASGTQLLRTCVLCDVTKNDFVNIYPDC